MRKILLIIAVLIGTMASAQVSKEDIRIYINPGHGAFDAGSRPMGTVKHGANNASTDVNNDTANFFESNTNLQKAFGLLEKLISFGVPFDRTKNQTNSNPHRVGAALDLTQNIVFSRVKSGVAPAYINYTNKDKSPESAYYDRSLSEVAAEVEFNEFDLFISIHSNALTEGTSTNYPLFLYRGTDSQEGNVGSIAVIKFCWSYILGMGHHQWTNKNENIHGDHSFYGSSTDRTYTIPEGSDYIYDETDSFSEYIPGTNGSAGYVKYKGYLGVLKHGVTGFLAEGYFHTYQPARHRYMNWDVCKLEGVAYARGIADYYDWDVSAIDTKGTIYGIVRDKNEKFTHEFYTPNTNTNDVYKPLNNVVVTLKKDNAVVATYTTDDEWNGAFVFNVEPGTYTIECAARRYKSQTMEVSVGAAKCTYPEVFLEKEDNYPDPIKGKKEFNLRSYYDVRVEKESNSLVTILADKTVRRQILRDDKLYVLALDADMKANVYVFDVAQDKLVKTLTATTAVGDILPLSDIALTTDGYLVGINKCNQAYDGAKNVTAYKWNNGEDKLPEGDAQIWWTSNFAGNWNNGIAGESMIYEGSTYDGKFIYTGTTTASTGNTRLVIVSISEGSYFGYKRNNQDGTYLSTSYVGDTYNMTLSPNADDKIIFDSEKILPFEIQLNPADSQVPTIIGKMTNDDINTKSNNASYFKYAGKSLMVTPDVNAEGNVSGIKLFDITDGLGNANEIELNEATLAEPVACNNASAHGELDIELNSNGEIVSADIELFLAIDGKVTKFTTADVIQSIISGVYAYNLDVEIVGNIATVSFNLSGKSNNVEIILTPLEGGDDIVYSLGSRNVGEISYEIDLADLIVGDYAWSISVANKTIYFGDIIATMNTWGAGSTYYRGGIGVEANPESNNFGTTYLGVGRSKGIFLLDPMYQVKQSSPYWVGQFKTDNASSTFRGALYNDKFYLSDWSDAYPGIWIFDPANPTAINNIFSGATNDGKGKLTINGVAVGGGSTGVAFTGKESNRKMFVYVEDLPIGNAGNKLYRYNIGAEDTWGATEPVLLVDASAKLLNTNTGLLGSALHNVVFCSQTRTAGQNTSDVPAFIVINEAGNIVFNSNNLVQTLDGCLGGGMALSADESRFAIVDASSAIQIYDVEWNGNVPSFTHVASLPTKDQEISQMSFDFAGNLHCINRKHGYYVHSVPNEARTVVTPAKSDLLIKVVDEATAIEDVETDENVHVEYYNLQGVKVENPSKGIFIKKQGNKTTKVVL